MEQIKKLWRYVLIAPLVSIEVLRYGVFILGWGMEKGTWMFVSSVEAATDVLRTFK